MIQKTQKPVILCVLDGWGYRAETADNAVALAKTPNWNRLIQNHPKSMLKTCGLDVGLPPGQMGNSEVGHMNLGAGRVVMQDLPRIDLAIADGSLSKNPILLDLIAYHRKNPNQSCHLMGLYSPGGVHSHQNHILALAKILNDAGIPVWLHLWTDGRDTPPQSARGYLSVLHDQLPAMPLVHAATICGRYYAMDRDKRWERVKLAYDAMISGGGETAADMIAAADASYARGDNDEFIKPFVMSGYKGIKSGDTVLCANFRSDRVRQIFSALLDDDFSQFAKPPVSIACAVAMTEYSESLAAKMKVLFAPLPLTNLMGEVVSRAGLTQLRIAETEKYPHVTFFFNGGEEKQYPGEDRIMVPSPKVATYDLQPEMSAAELTDKLVAAILSQKYDFILINYANPDMVGHSGILSAAIKACEAVDSGLGRIMEAVEKTGGVMLVTADHGNAEMMRDPGTGSPHTAHTLNPVQLALFNVKSGVYDLKDGRLADVAPTLLALLNIPQPDTMTGHSLLNRKSTTHAA